MRRVFLLTTLYEVISRGTIFFFIQSVILFSLYLLGNFQEFLDSTQIFLLKLLEVSLLLEVFLGIFHIVLIFFIDQKKHRFLKLILSFISVLFCYSLLLGFKFLAAWFQL
ncbi:hypothetical protein ES703_67202 [subsurface metagenome]